MLLKEDIHYHHSSSRIMHGQSCCCVWLWITHAHRWGMLKRRVIIKCWQKSSGKCYVTYFCIQILTIVIYECCGRRGRFPHTTVDVITMCEVRWNHAISFFWPWRVRCISIRPTYIMKSVRDERFEYNAIPYILDILRNYIKVILGNSNQSTFDSFARHRLSFLVDLLALILR